MSIEGTRPLFSALLTPHRALPARGIYMVVGLFAVLSLVPGLYFFLTGAWPIVGFMGLDILALWWALTHSHRDGRAFEEVTLYRDALDVRHVSPRGRERRYAFNPFYVRLDVKRDFDERVTRIALRERTQELEIGAFLNPDDKKSFAFAFGQALAGAKR